MIYICNKGKGWLQAADRFSCDNWGPNRRREVLGMTVSLISAEKATLERLHRHSPVAFDPLPLSHTIAR